MEISVSKTEHCSNLKKTISSDEHNSGVEGTKRNISKTGKHSKRLPNLSRRMKENGEACTEDRRKPKKSTLTHTVIKCLKTKNKGKCLESSKYE